MLETIRIYIDDDTPLDAVLLGSSVRVTIYDVGMATTEIRGTIVGAKAKRGYDVFGDPAPDKRSDDD